MSHGKVKETTLPSKPAPAPFVTRTFVNPAQVGGIESYQIGDGAGRGVRALCVNTGGGLRYRILVDRGFDIDQAFFNEQSLAFLTHKGVTPPAQGIEGGIDWLHLFPGGLLTTCGPFNAGPPGDDNGEALPLHGVHSSTPATIESIVQPDPRAGRLEMSAVARLRYGKLFGPNLELKRTIRSALGTNYIDITDEFFNAGNTPAPHAWLLHINLGYPLVDGGAELCYEATKVEPRNEPGSIARFKNLATARKIPDALDEHRGGTETFAYLWPRAAKDGSATVAIVNRKRGMAVAIRYDTRQFPRCGNWQHFGPGEYVTALEPMNCTVDGRWKDRAAGNLDFIKPGERKAYQYRIEVVTDKAGLDALRKLNG
jgi:hypothetical protein